MRVLKESSVRPAIHLVLAVVILLPSLATPAVCRVAPSETADTNALDAPETRSCCADRCQCPASQSSEDPCGGTACAQAPTAPAEESAPTATLPDRTRDHGKPSIVLVAPMPATILAASDFASKRASSRGTTEPPGVFLHSLCRLLI